MEDATQTDEIFREMLRDGDVKSRARAAIRLREYGLIRRNISTLISTLADPDKTVRNAARESLELMTDRYFGEDPAAWRDWLAMKGDSVK